MGEKVTGTVATLSQRFQDGLMLRVVCMYSFDTNKDKHNKMKKKTEEEEKERKK